MTPAARAQAAIEILTAVEQSMAGRGPAADVIIQRYFRSRRYAGSKDRASVIDRVYGVIRRRAELLWRLEKMGATPSPRMQVFAAALLDGETIDSWFEPGPHGPEPLDSFEIGWVDQFDPEAAGPLPPEVALEVPAWLLPALEDRFGTALTTEMAGLAGRAPVDLRVNTLAKDAADVAADLAAAGVETVSLDAVPNGLRVTGGDTQVIQTQAYREGRVEVQDAASQIAVALTGAGPGTQLIDLCAGAGGKTLALAACMANKGQIFAFDTDRRKLDELKKRADRAGVHNLQINRLTTGEKRDDQLFPFLATGSIIVVDAPCSGSGTWRRNPEARWRLEPDQLAALTRVQDTLLDEAVALARPNARIAYMTCSVLPTENEERVRAFLSHHQDWQLVDWRAVWQDAGLGGTPESLSSSPECLQLSPASHDTDGFFVALMERRGHD